MDAYGREPSLIVSDPPKHDKQRRQVMRHFAPPHSPDVIPNMESDIQTLCNELLDKAKAKGENRFDVVDDYAYPVPVAVICKILGVPLKDEPTFHGWIFDFMAGADMGPERRDRRRAGPLQKGAESTAALHCSTWRTWSRAILQEPGDNVLSKLVNDNDGPDGAMTPQEAASNAMLLLIAGHDSTVNTIAHCVLTLLRHPESLDLLREQPELIPKAIEEVLRLQSAVQFFPSRSVDRRHRSRRDRHPRGLGGASAVRRREPRPEAIPRSRRSSTSNARTTSTWVGVAECTAASAVRWPAWRSTWRWRTSCAASRTRAWSSIRRPTGRTRSSAARCISRSSSTGSRTEVAPSRPSSSSNGNSRANSGTCRCPSPGPGEVLVKVGGAGACHSDLHLLEAPAGSRVFSLPFTLGHENAGWVEKMGPGATGFAPGDPVIVYGPWGCGLCMNCRQGMENYCETPGKPSPGGLGGTDGGMAEYLLVPSTRYLIPLGSLDPREAAPLTDAGLTSYHAVKRSVHLLGPGSTAVVIGAGGLGQMAIQVLKALCSATTVVAVDTSADKLKIAKEMGADEALISGDDAVKRVKDMTRGQGAEVVLDFVGVNPTLTMAAQVARVLGHLTIVGLGNAALPVNFNSPPKECSVAAPFWGSIPELIEVITLAQSGKIQMLVEHFPLDRAGEAYRLLHDGKIQGRAVITPNN